MAEPLFNNDKILFVKVDESYPYGRSDDLYICTRGVWRVSKFRADNMDYILPHKNGIILGVFRATGRKWHPVEDWDIYPDVESNKTNKNGRLEFDGEQINDERVISRYVGKSIPEEMIGLQNPIRYWE